MSEMIIIGVDHGYAAMKTAHFSFPTGLMEYEHEPYTQKNVLEYGGRYFVVGSGRQPLQKDKIQTEDYYLLDSGGHRQGTDLPGRGAHRCRPSGRRPAPDQLWPGQEEVPGLPAPGGWAGLLPVRGSGLCRHHPGGVPVSPGLRRRVDPDRTAGRALRHRGGHRGLDGRPDAPGQPNP